MTRRLTPAGVPGLHDRGGRRLTLVGIGLGHPDHLTLEAVHTLQSASVALVTVKRTGDPLAALRRELLAVHAPDLEVVEVVDPERDRSAASTSTTSGYEGVVGDWHGARAAAWERALLEHPDGDAVVLVWGDPAFYDSTIRVVDRLGVPYDVLPGVSALSLLAARHRVVLHEVGRPVLVTTGRRLADEVAAGHDNLVVMLDGRLQATLLDGDWDIWWAANLGSPHEELVAGRLKDVEPEIRGARARAKAADGWVMDTYLLRRNSQS